LGYFKFMHPEFVIQEKNQKRLMVFVKKYKIKVVKYIQENHLELTFIENELALRLHKNNLQTDFKINFTSGDYQHRKKYSGGKKQTLIKVCSFHGKKNLKMIDANGGFCKDAFMLAQYNPGLIVVEKFLPLYILINNALKKHNPYNMKAIFADNMYYISKITEKIDVIFIDPMWQKTKNKAKANKNMQLLQLVYQNSQNYEKEVKQLIMLARKKAHKVVLKRHTSMHSVTTPTYKISDKNICFDIYC
jgi:16S rRNA (guanine1516-N2)-methyltransferase